MEADFNFNNNILARDMMQCAERGGNVPKKYIWKLPVIHYHKIMVIYHYPFWLVINQFFLDNIYQ